MMYWRISVPLIADFLYALTCSRRQDWYTIPMTQGVIHSLDWDVCIQESF